MKSSHSKRFTALMAGPFVLAVVIGWQCALAQQNPPPDKPQATAAAQGQGKAGESDEA